MLNCKINSTHGGTFSKSADFFSFQRASVMSKQVRAYKILVVVLMIFAWCYSFLEFNSSPLWFDIKVPSSTSIVKGFWLSWFSGNWFKARLPVGSRYPEGSPFGNNASVGSLFWVSICSSAACFPDSGRKEEPGKMEEPGLNFCRERFAIVLWTFCDFFPTFLPLMPKCT